MQNIRAQSSSCSIDQPIEGRRDVLWQWLKQRRRRGNDRRRITMWVTVAVQQCCPRNYCESCSPGLTKKDARVGERPCSVKSDATPLLASRLTNTLDAGQALAKTVTCLRVPAADRRHPSGRGKHMPEPMRRHLSRGGNGGPGGRQRRGAAIMNCNLRVPSRPYGEASRYVCSKRAGDGNPRRWARPVAHLPMAQGAHAESACGGQGWAGGQ